MAKVRRVYRTIDIPSDCESDPDKRFDLAILNARDEMRDYVMPANWRLVWDNGEQVRIVRESTESKQNG